MAEAAFPSQHTTTTVTTSTTVQTNLRYDPLYLRTVPGILKLCQVILNILGFICIEASGVHSSASRGSFFIFVATTAFWFTGILLVFYLFHVIEKFFKIPWLKIEGIFCATWVLLYLIASCLAATYAVEGFRVAAFFGFCAMVAYGYDAFLKYHGVRQGELAQGERAINKQITTITSPAY
ncbi:CKLF-like MARVEL transmembrane domain-containing protein 4 [Atheta coriaria]|uniref:CKLF-like MARVEL transmembrane domain-containing protein 4 n=1 Tax=Dalotia coriaria TaxID=877792 RepID=UPI0031F39EA0